ncbi:MAG: DUF3179 domain-containing protein, partial [Chloroflexi bacterium]|nr:DUF3179 domain-containing protein [Chloroflexota bacterium]
ARSCLPPSADALDAIGALGRSGDARVIWPLVDLLWVDVGWGDAVRAALTRLTGESLPDARAWSTFAAARTRAPALPGYAAWKAGLLALTATPKQTPTFAQLLEPLQDDAHSGLLERLTWTGVQPNASRPLAAPPHVEREHQRYLADGDVVYGVVVGSEARAYPERVVAWHGVVHDTIGEAPIVLAHCLSCGGAAAFRRADGDPRLYGTAGLALWGRTLLFDSRAHALWDALSGRRWGQVGADDQQPQLGTPLALFVTSWADWAARHPETTVLTLDTGVVRDYASGGAVRDELTLREPRFPAPAPGPLAAKEPVLGIVAGRETRAYPLALLARRRLVQEQVDGRGVLLLNEGAGLAAAAYEVGALRFTGVEGSGRKFFAIDEHNQRWAMREHALVHTVHGGELPALPRLQAYWFAWRGLHPDSTVAE